MSELCQILYSDEYSSTMSALRSLLEKKAYTEEALKLTETALDLLASHYTTWHYRFDIVINLKKDLLDELNWCEEIALENEKNYQVWNYRQRIIEQILKDPELARKFHHRREYPILETMLQQDTKNHHVWSYRKWLVERFSLHDDDLELAFTQKLIDADVRNNSAWTHRYFLRFKGTVLSEKRLLEEIELVKLQIDLCPQNPSTWNYLLGIYNQTGRDLTELKDFCLIYADTEKEVISSSFALEFLAKIAILEHRLEDANSIYASLSSKYDPIRKHYWEFLQKQLDLK
ncbi:protein prenylyltransferase [Metschnikowia bicuspidata var. bicuspidata NRRL YB-4993]|uniref:Protein farnesyltransferase/geranylgeranyltransferase type-1 subunit alpha n=1 Tax=Metschnikowia bicuspidata var. bicuspidata NRRL YB-4993 TaxID=869754 RepID=A0A1A0HAH5_9ASCO|nr:protein prenylyltransferase [Metschnikowia bicuspidata var. bicuspidata NRRL YB-4993]OBA20878.1 protein prenylyltransferase [Metschnikowia bicuspidata var. bicuspidata NRRL YB-4993]